MGYPQQYPPQGQPPVDNNMTMSIVSLFLFWPTAIPALINASKVNPALQAGDFAGAQQAAAESKKWSKLSVIIGVCVLGVSLLCCVGLFAFGAFSASTSLPTQ